MQRIFILLVAGSALLTAGCSKTAAKTSPIPAGAHTHIDSVTYYEVDGRTAGEVYRSMISRGPRTPRGLAYGYHLGSYSYRESYRQEGAVCRASMTIQSKSVITLPRWKFSNAADPTTQRAWSSFMLGLTGHEQVHRSNFLAGLDSIYVAVTSLTAPDCPTLRPLVADAINRARAKMRRDQESFDATDAMDSHGWPP